MTRHLVKQGELFAACNHIEVEQHGVVEASGQTVRKFPKPMETPLDRGGTLRLSSVVFCEQCQAMASRGVAPSLIVYERDDLEKMEIAS